MRKRILCFGDSNTWGANPMDGTRHPANVRWSGILQRELGEDFQIIEEGYNGRTTVFDDMVEGRLSGIKYFGPCLDSQSPLDLVILMLGTNDLKKRFGVDAGTIAYGLGRYLDTLKITPMEGNKPKVLVASPILIDEAYKKNALFYDMFGEGAVERSQRFAKAYEDFAKEAGIYYLNAAEYGTASKYDGVNMEAAEHEKLGKAFAAKVIEIVK